MPIPSPSRATRLFLCAFFLGSLFCLGLQAQSDDSSPQSAPTPTAGRIYGTVTDSAGNVIVGANVVVADARSKAQRTLLTDGMGAFNFSGLVPGTYQVSITAPGFAPWASSPIALKPGQYFGLSQVQLQIASAQTSVRVVYSQHELAEQQMHVQEKQRVLGVIPNFYTSYVWDAEPLSSGQKYRLGLRTSINPVTILASGAIAGVQQWQNNFKDYGQGAEGYAKRFGASYADGFIGVMLGGAVFPSLLHQDPRYFYKGTGTIRSRALYAISTVVICRGDNRRWQPNYSNVLGTFSAAGISNAYYPANDRGFSLTIGNAAIGLASGAVSALFQEFLLKKISRGVPPNPGMQR